MYSGLPRHARRMIKSTLCAAWLLSGLAGLASIPVVLTSEPDVFPPIWAISFGVLLAVGSTIAAIGVVANRYRWEWVSSWVAAAAISPYVVLGWATTLSGSWSGATSALLFTSLVMFFIHRGALCAAHATKLRKVHREGTAALETINIEGDGGDGISRTDGG